MAETSFPYGSVNHDRRYKSGDFRAYYAQLIGNGIIYSSSNALKVKEGGGMSLLLGTGGAFIEGVGYRNTSERVLELDMADGALSRIDRVVIRNDYKSRRTYAAVLKGAYSAQPQAAALTRNADAYEIAVADVLVARGVVSITQADITDTRLNKNLCGIVTGLIEQADTTGIFDQFETYYEWFKAKYTADVAEMMDTAGGEIAGYIAGLKAKGDADLASITQQLIDFRNTNEARFLEWFEEIKGIFKTDPDGKILEMINELKEQVEFNQTMITTGKVLTRIATSQGDYVADSMGNPILAGWSICKCASN